MSTCGSPKGYVMRNEDLAKIAAFQDERGESLKASFSAYFVQVDDPPTENRFMKYLHEALTSDDFSYWQNLYDELKSDLRKNPASTPPFPWL